MEKALNWWNNLSDFRKTKLIEHHYYWIIFDSVTNDMIRFMYDEEIYGY